MVGLNGTSESTRAQSRRLITVFSGDRQGQLPWECGDGFSDGLVSCSRFHASGKVSSADCDARPLSFTFVPTLGRLPAHIDCVDTSQFLVRIPEVASDHDPETVNRPRPADALPGGPRGPREGEQGTQPCPAEVSGQSAQGRGPAAGEAQEMQPSDLFKARCVFIVDSEGEDEVAGTPGDQRPPGAAASTASRPKSLPLGSDVLSDAVRPKVRGPHVQASGTPEAPATHAQTTAVPAHVHAGASHAGRAPPEEPAEAPHRPPSLQAPPRAPCAARSPTATTPAPDVLRSGPSPGPGAYLPVRIVTLALSPGPRPFPSALHGPASPAGSSRASSTGSLSTDKCPVPSRLALLTAILRASPPPARPSSPAPGPASSAPSPRASPAPALGLRAQPAPLAPHAGRAPEPGRPRGPSPRAPSPGAPAPSRLRDASRDPEPPSSRPGSAPLPSLGSSVSPAMATRPSEPPPPEASALRCSPGGQASPSSAGTSEGTVGHRGRHHAAPGPGSPRGPQAPSPPTGPEHEPPKPYKTTSGYKAFAAIPTNTLLLEQKALDEPTKTENVSTDSALGLPVEFCSPAQLRQRTEAVCAAIDKALQDSLSMTPTTVPRPSGRETKYANLPPASSAVSDSQLTKPGVIRPVPVRTRILLKNEEEAYEPNPFSKYLEESSGFFSEQGVTVPSRRVSLHPLYQTKLSPPAQSLLQSQPLLQAERLSPGPFSHLSSSSLLDKPESARPLLSLGAHSKKECSCPELQCSIAYTRLKSFPQV
ncbi:muscular LMNA-interacting protein [Thomomys bottae]